jgi:tRNA-Thr(GGU) m(6)t(6)A37 methyltransferase TsaA
MQWEAEGATEIHLSPIGYVTEGRHEVRDDYWGSVTAVIELDTRFSPDATSGLEAFSHIEVIFFMHKVNPDAVEMGKRRPRGNPSWPEVGIFAQRPKARPNRLGLSRCRLLRVEGLRLTVQALDAVVGTPILDIKPYMREYGPAGEVEQPTWASELMSRYYICEDNG